MIMSTLKVRNRKKMRKVLGDVKPLSAVPELRNKYIQSELPNVPDIDALCQGIL